MSSGASVGLRPLYLRVIYSWCGLYNGCSSKMNLSWWSLRISECDTWISLWFLVDYHCMLWISRSWIKVCIRYISDSFTGWFVGGWNACFAWFHGFHEHLEDDMKHHCQRVMSVSLSFIGCRRQKWWCRKHSWMKRFQICIFGVECWKYDRL